jgi:hypothetical protein
MSGAAVAQTYTTQTTPPDVDVDADVGIQPDGDLDVDADVDVDPGMTTTTTTAYGSDPAHTTHPAGTTTSTTTIAMAPASGSIVQPGNENPEHDARGIAVISDPAVVPAGFNGVAGTAQGGPLADPATGEAIDAADDSYPACSATVTDNCLQTYERGRSPQ